ncbi:uncharacterized protein EDB93DRAFT_594328 [Suillus bovinus]|uniref:uncharacterized protein n=1 Tax=Suillus bovinus TaxID=48563 RepID=UPI001B85C0DC|nr:uncharacterized protein EDB93DRAFT_594328 [Suillus bovinus]KAG2142830.1 hypothetical protein EDB93DRAFT_594328 [Suillus bovinus]
MQNQSILCIIQLLHPSEVCVMIWQNILDELKKAALTVSNQGPASESILGVKHLTLQHSADHWEELHAPVHAIFGWGQKGGLLSLKSSQADFLLIHNFLHTFAHVEQDVGEGSCLSAMVPRMETALELCQKAPRSPAHESLTCATSHGNQLVLHPSHTTSTASSTKYVDNQTKECIRTPMDTCQYQGACLQSRNIRTQHLRGPVSRYETMGL